MKMSENFKIYGIVAEYNPFHSGHAHQIAQIKAQGGTHIVAVMSGNFVQRGDFALWDKWKRTQCALEQGVDLVIELPLPWAMATAERFAMGAVSLLHGLGWVEELSFGCECGELEAIERCLEAMLSSDFSLLLKKKLQEGVSIASARQEAVRELIGAPADILSHANNTLGVEYCKALRLLRSPIRPHPILRVGPGHDSAEEHPQFLSASRLRTFLQEGKDVGGYLSEGSQALWAQEKAKGFVPVEIGRVERAILSKLRGMSEEDWRNVPDVSEGLEHRMALAVREGRSLEEVLDKVKTKRYPMARLRRMVLSAFLGLTQADGTGLPPYLRVLGCNDKGQEILQLARKNASLPLITKPAAVFSPRSPFSPRAKQILQLEAAATDLYALASPVVRECGLEFTENRVILK